MSDIMYKQLIKSFIELLRKNKILMLILSMIFLSGVFSGFILPSEFKLEILISALEKFGRVDGGNQFQNLIWIFLNNSFVGLLLLLLGFTLFLPALIIFFNGIIIGILLDLFVKLAGLNPTIVFGFIASILPHGIIEIPALIACAALGIMIGIKIFFKNYMGKTKRREFIIKLFKIYILILLPVFFLAALIEVFITPLASGGSLSQLGFAQDEKISNLILNTDELSNIGIQVKELPPEEWAEKTKALNKISYIESLSLLYNKEFYNEYKKIRDLPQSTKLFELDEHNFMSINILKFDSNEEVDWFLEFSDKMTEEISTKNNVTIIHTKEFDKVEFKGVSQLEKQANIEEYIYTISLTGDDESMFKRIAEMQREKLREKK